MTSSVKGDFHTFTTIVEKNSSPKKEEIPEMETIYPLKIAYTYDQQQFNEMRRCASVFVPIPPKRV